ncbi:MAG: diaminopimelate decarboxylase [Actinobacteria bacterium]|nr:diaminopimelate decarboxylase [Actinomycetota bacterium]MBV8561743.1 diaminopimelate decarboxylase [Actinomycetota bacterium]
MLELFPKSARVEAGELTIGGVPVSRLADEFGTPLVVYDEASVRAQARAYREAAPDALVVYGTKAFANVAILRLLAEEGVGADVSTLGELAFARAAGIAGDAIVFHGNNKSVEELRAAAEAGALVVLDAPSEVDAAAEAGVRRVLVRLTPGVEAVTHAAIRTAHEGTKFGLSPEAARAVVERARERGLDVEGVHMHVGSQLTRIEESVLAVERLRHFLEELDWTPQTIDLGGGLGIRYTREDEVPSVADWVGALLRELPAGVRPILEPGRSLVGRAGVTLYRVGVVKESGGVTYAAIDGGMSDNPRPQLYGARYEALLATRAEELPTGVYRIAGKHCETGDVLIDAAELPEPRPGDLLAVPATGAYTLALGSTYNGVPRPAAVLVADGEARLIRRRESVDELLRFET